MDFVQKNLSKKLFEAQLFASNSTRNFSIRHEKITFCVGERLPSVVYVVKHGKRIDKFYRALSISNGKQPVPICSRIILSLVYFIRQQGVQINLKLFSYVCLGRGINFSSNPVVMFHTFYYFFFHFWLKASNVALNKLYHRFSKILPVSALHHFYNNFDGGKDRGGGGGGGKLLALSFSKLSMFGSGRCCPTDSSRKSKRGGDGGGSKPPLVLLLLLLLFFLLKNSLPSWSLLNLDLSSKSLISGALSKNLLQYFFLPMSTSSIKEPISGFCTSKCFTCLNKS